MGMALVECVVDERSGQYPNRVVRVHSLGDGTDCPDVWMSVNDEHTLGLLPTQLLFSLKIPLATNKPKTT